MAMLAATLVSNMSQSENAFQKKVVTRALKKWVFLIFFLLCLKKGSKFLKWENFFFESL